MPEVARPLRPTPAVVIVGCGPVGMTLANLLGVYGVPTLVLERNAGLYDHPRAVGTDCDSLRVWQAADLHEKLLADMTPMGPDGLGMVYLDAAGRPFMEVRPGSCEYGFAFGYGLVQPLVDRVLFDGLARFEEVDVRFGHRVDSIAQDEDGVRVRGHRIDDRPFEFEAAYAVACDGGGSGTRRQLGIRMLGRSYRRCWLVLDTIQSDAGDDRVRDVEIHCDPERPSVSVPRRYGHRRFELLQRPGESEAALQSPETVRELLRRHVDPDRIEIIRSATHVFSARVAERFRAGRILLAGDAAHVTPPFAAQGLACGIRDVFNLAWKLALVLRAGASDQLLDSYEAERRSHDRASVKLAVRLGWLMMPRSRARAAITQRLIRQLVRVPRIRRFVREGGPKPPVRYTRGFVTGGRRSLSGRALPQPWVEDAKGRRRRLDDALGAGFALVGFGVDPGAWISPEDRARWQRLGTRLLRVLPSGATCEGEHELLDCDGAFVGRWRRVWGRCLLVRPDRFVAADAAPGDLAAALQTLEQQIFARCAA